MKSGSKFVVALFLLLAVLGGLLARLTAAALARERGAPAGASAARR